MLDKYKCGACGGSTYGLWHDTENNRIITECRGCDCKSVIIVQSSLNVEWFDIDQPGTMCKGW